MTTAGAGPSSELATAAALPRPLNPWVWLGIGMAAASVGLLPWLVTGLRLPLQNLWGTTTAPQDMPLVLLPFSQYSITLVAGLLVVGAAIAGLVARSTRPRQGHRGFAALTAGVFGTQLIAVVQTTAVVGGGLRPGTESTIYLVAVVAVALTSVAVGGLVFVLIGTMPRAGALIGLSLAAVAVGWWGAALIVPQPGLVSPAQTTMLGLLQWLPAILCGVAIAWCGVNTAGRVGAALTAVAAVVIGPAVAPAVSAAAGTRVRARYPGEMLDYAAAVFRQVLVTPELTLRPLIAAIVVAGLGLALQTLRRRPAGSTPNQ